MPDTASARIDFDFLIVGGGSAGCVLANRLSADSANQVMLIEAGIDTPPGAVPAEIEDSYPMPLFHGDTYIWPGLQAKVSATASATRLYEQGRVLGGGSTINVQAANRGMPRDYDEWDDLGATGWTWNDVLPYFRRLETDLDYAGPLHGQDGPLPIRRLPASQWPPFAHRVAEIYAAHGHPAREDQNAEFEDGVFPPAISNTEDKRASAAQAYLPASVRQRPNLTISTGTRVLRLVLDQGLARGVEVVDAHGERRTLTARHVVVTAGALQTPALLMRAGIGPGQALHELGIPVLHDTPGVGQNLREHPGVAMCQYLPPSLRLPMTTRRAHHVILRYSSNVDGGSASDMYLAAGNRASWHAVGQRLGIYFLWCNRPHSSGSLRLTSASPDVYPAIAFNLLQDDRDLQRLAHGVRKVVAMMVDPRLNAHVDDLFPATFTPAIRRMSLVSDRNRWLTSLIGAVLDAPRPVRSRLLKTFMLNGASMQDLLSSEQSLAQYLRQSVAGIWHASGTCRMGRADDPMAVVDPQGKVIGMANMWVADASVMPRLPTANTNVPVIMIAEKIADAMLGRTPLRQAE